MASVTGVEVCGAAHIMGGLSWAQHVLFLSLWPSLCLDPQGLTAFGEWVQGVERCNGSVQTYTQPVHPILL